MADDVFQNLGLRGNREKGAKVECDNDGAEEE
jgi:hypothetical protein